MTLKSRRVQIPLKAGLLIFAFAFISPLYAEPESLPDEEPELFLNEETERLFTEIFEYIISEEAEPFLSDEAEILINEELEFLLSEEAEYFISEESESFPNDESEVVISEEPDPFSDGEFEIVISEEPDLFPDDESEVVISEETDPFSDGESEIVISEEPDLFPDDESEVVISEEPDPFSDGEFGYIFSEESELIFYAEPIPLRTFNAIFPDLTPIQRRGAFSNAGIRYAFEKDDPPMLNPAVDSGINLLSSVMEKGPSHIIEAIVVVPYKEKEFDMLDIYNALSRISNIKEYTIPIRGQDANIFKETTRIESATRRRAISDPPPATFLPSSERMYLRFEDAYIGNLYIRGDVSISSYGITYNMTNFRSVFYFIIPIMKAEKFSAILYLEPLEEGILVYCMSGLYIPGFVADRVNLTPNINQRISVFISWIIDGLKKQVNTVR